MCTILPLWIFTTFTQAWNSFQGCHRLSSPLSYISLTVSIMTCIAEVYIAIANKRRRLTAISALPNMECSMLQSVLTHCSRFRRTGSTQTIFGWSTFPLFLVSTGNSASKIRFLRKGEVRDIPCWNNIAHGIKKAFLLTITCSAQIKRIRPSRRI